MTVVMMNNENNKIIIRNNNSCDNKKNLQQSHKATEFLLEARQISKRKCKLVILSRYLCLFISFFLFLSLFLSLLMLYLRMPIRYNRHSLFCPVLLSWRT